jgi:predicted dehydrogenase
MDSPLRLAICGCGARGRTYARLAAQRPDRYALAAGADLVPARVEAVRALAGPGDFRGFPSAEALLATPRLADVLVVSTQDADHLDHALRGLALGYHLLLEKPAATRPDDLRALADAAARARRRVLVCYVLRYTPLYRAVKGILDSGRLGELVTLRASEGVMPWHQAHSFVRGHWGNTGRSSPMLLAKCSHDLDLLPWLVGRRCVRVQSFGGLAHFRAGNVPSGAPARCTDGCPHAPECPYDAHRYAREHRGWLAMVFDRAREAPEAEIVDWLRASPWGRCVYRCDNDAVDHQTLNLEFAGGLTGTFTLTAFDHGRHLEVFGTRGWLRAGSLHQRESGAEILVGDHVGGPVERIVPERAVAESAGHGGGDEGLMEDLHREMTGPAEAMSTSLENALHSHFLAFAAEASRHTGRVVDVP